MTSIFKLLAIVSLIFSSTVCAQTPRSPDVLPDRRVTFRLAAPKATEVTLRASWSGNAALPMTKDDSGVWSVTVGPLKADLYNYAFIVDGVRALDPNNAETERDGLRFSSLLLVSDPTATLWEFRDVPHGSIEQVWYAAPTMHMKQRRMYVYLPPDYHQTSRKYPVLYLLHGGGGDEDAWTTLGRAAVILDNQLAAGAAMPMIVVMPNGTDDLSASPGSGLGSTPSYQQLNVPPPDMSRFALHLPQPPLPYEGVFAESLVKDIVPFIEKAYRVQADVQHRAIAGLSRGAAQTVVITANNPGMFGYIGVFSGGGLVGDPKFEAQLEALARAKPKLYWTGAGDDDIARMRTAALYESAKAKGLPATHKKIPGTHAWPVWRDFLADFSARLFK